MGINVGVEGGLAVGRFWNVKGQGIHVGFRFGGAFDMVGGTARASQRGCLHGGLLELLDLCKCD